MIALGGCNMLVYQLYIYAHTVDLLENRCHKNSKYVVRKDKERVLIGEKF